MELTPKAEAVELTPIEEIKKKVVDAKIIEIFGVEKPEDYKQQKEVVRLGTLWSTVAETYSGLMENKLMDWSHNSDRLEDLIGQVLTDGAPKSLLDRNGLKPEGEVMGSDISHLVDTAIEKASEAGLIMGDDGGVTVEPYTMEDEARIIKQALEREDDRFRLTPDQEETIRRAAEREGRSK